jgi:hypothetical protein
MRECSFGGCVVQDGHMALCFCKGPTANPPQPEDVLQGAVLTPATSKAAAPD